jgi:general secretion pathway protein E
MTITGARIAPAPGTEPAQSTRPAAEERQVDLLAGLLLRHGQCDSQTIDRGRRVATESGQRLDKVLIQLGLVTERGLAEAYSTLLGVPITSPARYPEAALFPERLSPRFLRTARACPLAVEDNVLVLAVADALDDFTPAAVAAATNLPVRLEIAVPIELEAAFSRLYPEGEPGEGQADADSGAALEEDAERLKDLASEAPVIRLVNQIIGRAVETHASDIHVEPFEDRLRVRYRYDGVLHEADSPAARLAPAIISRIKIMAKLDIAERRLPQDGRIKMAVRGTEIDFRVSTIPSLYGEKVVLRVLDRSSVVFDYVKLGLPAHVVDAWTKALELPNGILLVTGPTGSGKTTTLYTGLTAINAVSRNIVTVEDPIEYQLNGINQIQTKPQIGLTFATLLRSILRQDPDVIMVGEIRDLETAQIAVQATITRLRDMGLEDYLVTAVLRGVLAQRLVRRLCDSCKREAEAPTELIQRFDLQRRANGHPVRLWHPVGCAQCRSTGYRGRQAIAEFLVPDAAIEHLIFSKADQNEIERAAVSAGMITMFQAGLDAALAGTTTIEEVVRSIRAEA